MTAELRTFNVDVRGRAVATVIPWASGGRTWLTVVVKTTYAITDGVSGLVHPQGWGQPAILGLSERAPWLGAAGIVIHAREANARSRILVRSPVVAAPPSSRGSGAAASGMGASESSPTSQKSGLPQFSTVLDKTGPFSVEPANSLATALLSYVRSGWIELPAVLDFGVFQPAPADQRLPTLTGKELIVLDNIPPLLPQMSTRLPGVSLTILFEGPGSPPNAFQHSHDSSSNRELSASPDVLAIDMSTRQLTLLHRASVEIDPRALQHGASPCRFVVEVAEPTEDPRSVRGPNKIGETAELPRLNRTSSSEALPFKTADRPDGGMPLSTRFVAVTPDLEETVVPDSSNSLLLSELGSDAGGSSERPQLFEDPETIAIPGAPWNQAPMPFVDARQTNTTTELQTPRKADGAGWAPSSSGRPTSPGLPFNTGAAGMGTFVASTLPADATTAAPLSNPAGGAAPMGDRHEASESSKTKPVVAPPRPNAMAKPRVRRR